MALEYSEEVKKNFLHPENMGEMENPDGVGKLGNPTCGDIMWVYIKVGKRKDKEGKDEEFIENIKFRTFGCAAAIATSSMITQLAKGKEIEESKKITTNDVATSLKGLPPIKMHCASMTTKSLDLAIKDYRKKQEGKIN